MSIFRFGNVRLPKVGGRLLAGAVLALSMAVAFSYPSLPARAYKADNKPVVAVSTTLLEAGVRNIYGSSVEIYRIMPPGSCPGHYDMTPQDLEALMATDVVVLHSYQEHMREKLAGSGLSSKPVIMVSEKGSMIIPRAYSDMLKFLAEKLPENVEGLSRPDTRLSRALQMVLETGRKAREMGKDKLSGVPVAVAFFQEDFCRWLGMEIATTIDAGSDISLSRFHRILTKARKGDAALVVGNRQSGQKEYEILAERLHVPLVVLSNFPDADSKNPYRELLLSNVKSLVKALETSAGK